jgi:hypothetical protein
LAALLVFTHFHGEVLCLISFIIFVMDHRELGHPVGGGHNKGTGLCALVLWQLYHQEASVGVGGTFD